MALCNPVVVVPGITASRLRDEYPASPEIVWNALKKDFRRVSLHPEDLRYELIEPARVRPDAAFTVVYEDLLEELRYNLSDAEDRPVPVYPFAYDWRQPLETTEALLARFIDEVIDRTKLLGHYHRADYADEPKVDLVGHSMGGLIIAGYLADAGAGAPVGKVVTLGSPFRGSLEAPLKITTGTADLGEQTPPASREREAARLTPALYYLLPSFETAVFTESDDIPDSLFEIGAWQESIVKTLAAFIKNHGVERTNASRREELATELFSGLLGAARVHRQKLESLDFDQLGMSAEDWLCVVGVDAETRVRLKIDSLRNKPVFDLTSDDRCNEWDDAEPDQQFLTGDGTVPFLGAEPGFLDRSNLVCVKPKDFGYWELKDKAMAGLSGFHGMLPNLNLAHRLIVSHFRGRKTKGIWGRSAPSVADDEWKPAIPNLRRKDH